MEIQRVHMDHIEGGALQDSADGLAIALLGGGMDNLVQGTGWQRNTDQLAFGARAFAGNHGGSMSQSNERAIELSQNLFGAAGGIGTYGRERVGDAEHRKLHTRSGIAKVLSDSVASCLHRSPVMPQGKFS